MSAAGASFGGPRPTGLYPPPVDTVPDLVANHRELMSDPLNILHRCATPCAKPLALAAGLYGPLHGTHLVVHQGSLTAGHPRR